MYNTDLPTRADLPTSARLWRSTLIAIVSAIAILVVAILPGEYGLDPTGIGRVLGLTQMGEIKTQLAMEAEADRQATAAAVQQTLENPGAPVPQAPVSDPLQLEIRLSQIEGQLNRITEMLEQQPAPASSSPSIPPAADADSATENLKERMAEAPIPTQPEAQQAPEWRDEISITLEPGQGVEFKLVMEADATAEFHWTANGSVLNYDTHGDGSGNSISYEKGRSVPDQEGQLRAAFTGNHGWFWRNRTDEPVTLTLRIRGDYSELKRTV